jgi:hypothetical protein
MRNLLFHRMVIGLVLLLTIDIGSAAAWGVAARQIRPQASSSARPGRHHRRRMLPRSISIVILAPGGSL